MRRWKTVAVLVICTFISMLCLCDINFMFWTATWGYEGYLQNLEPPQTWVYSNWVDIWWGDTPLLQITVYNSFCIFWMGIFLSLVLLWVYLFYAFWKRNKG